MTIFSERIENGKLGLGKVGEIVRLLGWVQRRRDHGGLILSICGIAQALFRLSLGRRKWERDLPLRKAFDPNL